MNTDCSDSRCCAAEAIKQKILDGSFVPDWSSIQDQDAVHLIKQLLMRNSKTRATPAQILNHRWVKGDYA